MTGIAAACTCSVDGHSGTADTRSATCHDDDPYARLGNTLSEATSMSMYLSASIVVSMCRDMLYLVSLRQNFGLIQRSKGYCAEIRLQYVFLDKYMLLRLC